MQNAPHQVIGKESTTGSFHLNCLFNERVVVSSTLRENAVLTTTILANAGQQRRYLSEQVNDAASVQSFDSVAGSIHVLRDTADGISFTITLAQPRVILMASKTPNADTNDVVSVTFMNDDAEGNTQEFTVKRNVVIRA